MKKHTKINATLAAAMIAMTASSYAAVLWTPADISTYSWFDAADASTITDAGGGLVSQWNDKSGNDFHATQGNNANRPTTGTRTIGGLNALDFDAKALSIPAVDLMGQEAWGVFQIDTKLAGDPLAPTTVDFTFLGGGGNAQITVLKGGNMRLWKSANPYNNNNTAGTVADDSATVGGWLAHNDFKKFSLNGTLTTTGDTPTGNNMTVTAIGSSQYANADGAFGEIVITSGELSLDDRARMEGYLAWKWGTEGSLPEGHAYEFAAPVVPEPSTTALLGLGGLALIFRRRK